MRKEEGEEGARGKVRRSAGLKVRKRERGLYFTAAKFVMPIANG
jgi:hypothetical protein